MSEQKRTTEMRHREGLDRRRYDPAKAILALLRGAPRVLYFLVGVGAILVWSYLFGHPLLEGGVTGGDSAYHLSIISWIDRWFPKLPLWYPLQGGGSSSIVQYPYGVHFLVVVVHKLTGLGLVQVFRLTQLLSVAITAVGIYTLVWVKLRNQTMALLAGLFYPLSAAAWPWLTNIGLFGQAVSLIYFAPTFLLFDAYLLAGRRESGGNSCLWRRLVFPTGSLAFCIMFITNGATGAVFTMAITLYAILLPLASPSRRSLLKEALLSALRALTGIAAGLGLAAFWLLPYLHLSGLANREGVRGEFALHQIPYLDLGAMVGLREPPALWGTWALSFASSVVILAGIGFLLSLRRRNVAVLWGVLAVAFALYTAMPGIWPGLVGVFRQLWARTYVRALIPTMIFLPALAGYGAGEIARLIADVPLGIVRLTRGRDCRKIGRNELVLVLKSGVAMILTLAIAYLAFVYLRHPPVGYGSYPGYGATAGGSYWPFDFDGSRVTWARRPEFKLSANDVPAFGGTAQELVNVLGLTADTRLDVSPYHGALLEVLPLYTDASTINIYSYGASLIHQMWGNQVRIFYSHEPGSQQELNQFAKWFGLQYVVLNTGKDPLDRYDETLWPVVFPVGGEDEGWLQVRRFTEAQPMADVLRRPTVLVIGGYEKGIYEQAFRVFNQGALSYEDALAIEGKHNVDGYSLDELRNFDVVFLHGYGYRNRDRAWKLLDDYVAEGGSLFVDTGWQYSTPDWQMEEAPAVLPVRNLVWTNFGMTDDFSVEDTLLGSKVETDLFSPLIWDGQPWGVSAPASGLREWASTVLAVAGQPLVVAGEYGDGKVIWSGMNLIGHALTYENAEERAFLGSLIRWLLPNIQPGEIPVPLVEREHPDRIVFSLRGPMADGTYLLWREAHSPDWHAFAEVEGSRINVPIYRAGPGMMLLRLLPTEAAEFTVTMEYSFGWVSWAGTGVSFLIGAGLVVGVVSPTLWPSLLGRLGQSRRRTLPQGSVPWLPDLTTIQDAQAESEALRAADEADAASAEGDPGTPSPGDVGDEAGSGEDSA